MTLIWRPLLTGDWRGLISKFNLYFSEVVFLVRMLHQAGLWMGERSVTMTYFIMGQDNFKGIREGFHLASSHNRL